MGSGVILEDTRTGHSSGSTCTAQPDRRWGRDGIELHSRANGWLPEARSYVGADAGAEGRLAAGWQRGALEGSNVNISAEFSKLIIAQRAFEANSKTITTFDTITQETINMIH